MLEIKNLNTGYEKKQVVFDVSLNVSQGEIVSLIGPNGAGKSTILKATCGLIPSWSGEVIFEKNKVNERIQRVLEIFPVLQGRLKQNAGSLSGGEQQMLAVARALIPEPKLLLFDEPSLGLAPNLLKGLFDKFVELNKKLGITILIVEQKVREVLKISDRVYSLKLGSVSFSGKSEELLGDKETLKTFFLY